MQGTTNYPLRNYKNREQPGRFKVNFLGLSDLDGGGRDWWIEDENGEQVKFIGNDKNNPDLWKEAEAIAARMNGESI